MKIKTPIITAILALAAVQAQAMETSLSPSIPATSLTCGNSIYGAWVTNEGKSIVNIHDCGSSNICGDVVKFEGDVKYSEVNPHALPALANISGPRILNEFKVKSDSKFKGRIFNPRNGKSYKSILKISEIGELKVKGCLGPICETKTWMRPQVCS